MVRPQRVSGMSRTLSVGPQGVRCRCAGLHLPGPDPAPPGSARRRVRRRRRPRRADRRRRRRSASAASARSARSPSRSATTSTPTRSPAALEALEGVQVLWHYDRALLRHEGGKLQVEPTAPVRTVQDMRDVYTPGVARVCLAIAEDPALAMPLHDDRPHGRDLHERHARARPRRHRPGRVDAGDGGQGDLLQAVHRPRRDADPDRHARPRRVRRDRDADRPGLRRHPPRGHLGAGVLRDRGRADRRASTCRSCTTTSTAPRSSTLVGRARRPAGRPACGSRTPWSASSASAPPGFGIAALMRDAGVRRVLASDPNEAVARARARARDRDRRPRDRDGARPTSSSRRPAGPGLITPEMVRPGQVILALTNPVPGDRARGRAGGRRRVRRRRHVGQQRARLPGHLPRRARRRRARDHDAR